MTDNVLAIEIKTMTSRSATASITTILTAIVLGSAPAHAHELEQVDRIFEHAIPNISGKSLVAFVVSYPPGAKSLPHRHAGSAFIFAHVLSGSIRSQVDSEPPKIYRTGESFRENPGSHHSVSENASDGEPAKLLAVFIVDSKDEPATIPDKQ